jgi:hypothetical protein
MMRAMRLRLLHDWPIKLAAVAVAALVWAFVTNDPTATAQRTLVLPIVVDGLDAERIAVGVPSFVEATVRGPAPRVDRLRPEAFEAVLDLSGAVGDFQTAITVAGPEGIEIEGLAPGNVIGRVETLARAEVPVVAAVIGGPPPGLGTRTTIVPANAVVSGRAEAIARVAAVAIALPSENLAIDGTLTDTGYAIDADGRPIDAVVEGGSFSVTWSSERLYRATTLPLVLEPLPTPWTLAAPPPSEVTLFAVPGALADVDAVTASADLPTEAVAGERYDVALTWRLPAGAVPLTPPRVLAAYAPDLNAP